MDIESVRQSLENAGPAAMWLAFFTGFLFSFNPVAVAAIPVSLAYVTRARQPRQALVYGAMFILGMIVTHVFLGVVAGMGGEWAKSLLGRYWGVVLGPLLIVLGLVWAGWLKLPLPALSFRAKRATGILGAFALGIPFSVAICPFCTPILVVLLGVVASLGSPWMGGLMLLAFAVGRALPIALGAVAIGWLEHLNSFVKYQRVFDISGGVILMAMGLYMLNAYFFIVPALAA